MNRAAPVLNGNANTTIGNAKKMAVSRNLNVMKERWKVIVFDIRRKGIFIKTIVFTRFWDHFCNNILRPDQNGIRTLLLTDGKCTRCPTDSVNFCKDNYFLRKVFNHKEFCLEINRKYQKSHEKFWKHKTVSIIISIVKHSVMD